MPSFQPCVDPINSRRHPLHTALIPFPDWDTFSWTYFVVWIHPILLLRDVVNTIDAENLCHWLALCKLRSDVFTFILDRDAFVGGQILTGCSKSIRKFCLPRDVLAGFPLLFCTQRTRFSACLCLKLSVGKFACRVLEETLNKGLPWFSKPLPHLRYTFLRGQLRDMNDLSIFCVLLLNAFQGFLSSSRRWAWIWGFERID